MDQSDELTVFRPSDSDLVLSWLESEVDLFHWAGLTGWQLRDAAIFEQWHTDPDIKPFLLAANGETIGYGECWLDPSDNSAELARLLIAPTHRGHGHGARLVRELLTVANSHNPDDIWMRVAETNTRAESLYNRLGFQRIPADEKAAMNEGERLAFHWLRYSDE